MNKLKGVLDDETWNGMNKQWRIAAYPNVYPNVWSVDLIIQHVLDSELLAPTQRLLLEEIRQEYQIEMDQLSEEIEKQVRVWRRDHCLLKPHQPNKIEMIRIEFYAMDDKRKQLSMRTIQTVVEELTKRQQELFMESIRKWKSKIDAIPANRLGYGMP